MFQNARNFNRRNAQMYYLLGLIAAGRSKDAADLLKKFDLTAATPDQLEANLPNGSARRPRLGRAIRVNSTIFSMKR